MLTPVRSLPLAAVSSALIAVIISLMLAAPSVAFADAIGDKRRQAAAIQAQIDALDTKASIADEAYNQARERHSTLSARAAAATKRVAQLESRKLVLQEALGVRADQMYRGNGSLGMLAMILSSRSLAEFSYTVELMTRVSEGDAAMVSQLKQTETEARVVQKVLVASRTEAARQEASMASSARAVRGQLAARTRVLAGLDSDIKALIAAEQARQAAAAQARYRALLARRRTGAPPSGRSPAGGNPPPSGKAATAVYWAEKAIGKPYVWAASGPNSFDCSGLTMWAYQHAGVSLPHSSRDQIHHGASVSRSNLQPGDLVFFYSPIHHVGMYVGGGYFVEAPHAGARVQITSLAGYGHFAGACRP